MLQTMKGCGPGNVGLCHSFAHACEAVFQGVTFTLPGMLSQHWYLLGPLFTVLILTAT